MTVTAPLTSSLPATKHSPGPARWRAANKMSIGSIGSARAGPDGFTVDWQLSTGSGEQR